MNEKKVPQLFVATGATKWNDPKQFPWTMGWATQLPERRSHLCQVYFERKGRPARSVSFIRTMTMEKTMSKALRDGLGSKADLMIIAEKSYETTNPSIDSLRSGAQVGACRYFH